VRGHRRGDEPRLDGEDLDAARVQAIAEAGEKRGERCLGRTIYIVRLAAAVSGYRTDNSKTAVLFALAIIRQPRQQRNRRQHVGQQDGFGRGVTGLVPLLIAEDAVSEEREVHAAERFDTLRDERGVRGGVVKIGGGGDDERCAPRAQVRGDGFEAVDMTADEKKAGAAEFA
jgi:hypothetical protein